jgi:hypothetical protein
MVSASELRLLTRAEVSAGNRKEAAKTGCGPENKVSEFCFNLHYVSNSLQHVAAGRYEMPRLTLGRLSPWSGRQFAPILR